MYVVLELQKTGNDIGSIITKKDTYNEAMSLFHTILAAAAISQVEAHSAVVLSDDGQLLKNGTFYHLPEVEEEN